MEIERVQQHHISAADSVYDVRYSLVEISCFRTKHNRHALVRRCKKDTCQRMDNKLCAENRPSTDENVGGSGIAHRILQAQTRAGQK